MPRHIEPGTIVKVNTGQLAVPRDAPAILLSMDGRGSVRLFTDAGTALVVRREIRLSRVPMLPFAPMRLRLAYGAWTEEDGSKVLFSRDYCPLWRISPDGRVTPEDPWRWITFIDQEWFWDDVRTPWRNRNKAREIERRMQDMGMPGRPKLMSVLDWLVRGEVDDILDGVRLMVPPGVEPHTHL